MKETNFKPSPLGPIPYDWVVIPLGNLGEVQMCKRIFSNQTSETGEIPFFKIGTLGKAPDAFISRELYEKYKKLYNFPLIGELLISAAGTIGRTHKYDGADCYYQDSNIVWLRNDEKQVSNRYLAQTFKIIKWQSQDGGTISRLYNSNFRATLCCYPTSLTEQEKIAGVLSDVDELIATTEALLQKKRDIKQGTMQQLLSGKRRLPGFSQPWETTDFYSIYKYASEGGTPNTHISRYYTNGNIPFAKIEDTATKYIYGCKSSITSLGLSNSSAWLIPENSIILSNGATIGNVAINRIPISTKQGILGIILNNHFDVEFIFYLLSDNKFQEELHARESGGTFATVILKNINNIKLNIPTDLAEQQAIAKVLTDMDNEIDALENNLDKYKAIREAMMQQLLTGKIRLI